MIDNKIPLVFRFTTRVKEAGKKLVVRWLPYFSFIRETTDYKHPITFDVWFEQKVAGHNRYCYWPIHPTSRVTSSNNVRLGAETFPGFMPGCYIQAIGKITIGDHTIIAPNVGLISSNHSLTDAREWTTDEIQIGNYCWIGMNSTILPGVKIGDFTIVGAGSVVTKSFPDGFCVVAGNPAKLIKKIPQEECVRYGVAKKYHGYLSQEEYFCRFPDAKESE
jgi:acetyltransferase-like isoleucine patch superfamily enzyme